MPRVHVTGGYLNVDTFSPEGPVDPGFGSGIGGGHIDNTLPPGAPPIGGTLPEQPPQVWPPISWGNPIAPIIDNTLPVQPGTIWPSPGRPPHVDAGLPVAPVRPGQPLPPSPGHPGGGPMPGGERPDNSLPSKTFWMLCYAPSLGWRFVAVDPSLKPGMPLPPAAAPKG